MMRRTIAGLLALLLLVTVLPTVVAADDDKVYEIGETLWVTGLGVSPTAETVENGEWKEVRDTNGDRVTQPGCISSNGIHVHTLSSCYDAVDGLTCTLQEHSARDHAQQCSWIREQVLWHVVEIITEPEEPGDGEGSGGSGDVQLEYESGIEDPVGEINLTVLNIDTNGNPLNDSIFVLTEYAETEVTDINGNTTVKKGLRFVGNPAIVAEYQAQAEAASQEKLAQIDALNEAGDPNNEVSALIDELNADSQRTEEELQALDWQVTPKQTESDGKVYFRSLEKYLDEDNAQEDDDGNAVWTWYLAQDGNAFADGTDLALTHQYNDQIWTVKITRSAAGTYGMRVQPDEAVFKNQESGFAGANPAYGSVTFVNRSLKCQMIVNFECVENVLDEDGQAVSTELLMGRYLRDASGNFVLDEDGYPRKLLNVKADVSVDGPNDYHKDLVFSEASNTWQEVLTGLEPGEYTVTLQVDSSIMGAEGYNWVGTIRTVETVLGTGQGDDITVTLDKDCTAATFTFTAEYEPIVEDSGTVEPPETPDDDNSDDDYSDDEYYDDEYYDDEYDDDEKTMENEIVVKAVDDRGQKLTGAKFELVGKRDEPVPLEVDSNGVIQEDWEAYAEEGKQLSWIIRQSNTINGHEVTTDEFSVQITKSNGVPLVVVSLNEGNLFERLLSSNKIKEGSEGETILYFENPRKTAQINVSYDLTVNVEKSCRNASETKKEFEEKTHSFVLSWKDDNGKAQEEVLELAAGAAGVSKAEIPFGTEYTLTVAGPYQFDCEINGEAATFIKDKVTAEQAEEGKVKVTADIAYDIDRGVDQDLYMTKVSSAAKKPLSGAKFTLLDSDGNELEDYTTKKDGAIDIEDMFDEPGYYYLKEVKAPDGCIRLRKPIEINVVIGYEAKQSGSHIILEQCLELQINNSSVELQSDGTYNIKNIKLGENPKTGDNSNITIWMGMMVISMAGLSAVAVGTAKKKHRGRYSR